MKSRFSDLFKITIKKNFTFVFGQPICLHQSVCCSEIFFNTLVLPCTTSNKKCSLLYLVCLKLSRNHLWLWDLGVSMILTNFSKALTGTLITGQTRFFLQNHLEYFCLTLIFPQCQGHTVCPSVKCLKFQK